MPYTAEQATHTRDMYWRRVRSFTFLLLALWFLSTFGLIFFARELSGFTVFGWPLSFYMAAQGLTLFYVAIVALYAKRMQSLDKLMKGDTSNVR